MQLLLGAYLDSIKQKGDRGMLPLHIAVENGASQEVVRLLEEAAAKEAETKRKLHETKIELEKMKVAKHQML